MGCGMDVVSLWIEGPATLQFRSLELFPTQWKEMKGGSMSLTKTFPFSNQGLINFQEGCDDKPFPFPFFVFYSSPDLKI